MLENPGIIVGLRPKLEIGYVGRWSHWHATTGLAAVRMRQSRIPWPSAALLAIEKLAP
jgi:hypothetical protein